MDGVVANTYPSHYHAYSVLRNEQGRPLPEEEFTPTFGFENLRAMEILLGPPADPEERLRDAARKEEIFREHIAANDAIYPGIRELIAELRRQGIRLALASAAPRANVEQILRSGQILDQLEFAMAVEDAPKPKPAPDIYLAALKRLQLSAADCWVIEDSLQGIEAAQGAGIRCLALATTRQPEELTHAEAVFASALELLDFVRKMG